MNDTMMSISKMLATEVLTRFMVSLLSCPKPHITAATKRLMPPSVSKMVLLMRFMRWNVDVMMMPKSVEKNVASRMGMNTSVGCAAPSCAL